MAKKKAEVPVAGILDKVKVQEILQSLLSDSIKRFRQEVLGENEDLLDMAVRKYRSKVSHRTWRVAQKWCKWVEEGPVLMPDHTRLYYKKGQTEVIVQEFAPQVRHMKFKGPLVSRNGTDEAVSETENDKTYSYSLALPYMIFLFRFVDGVFQECYIAFCDRPLKKLQEKPLRPYLSNLDSNLKLCHGHSFMRNELIKSDLVQQVALVLNNFWATIYSDEWSMHYWATKKHFNEDNVDVRLKTLENWQEASLENPLFVIEDVSWLPHSEESFGDMIVRMFEHDSDDGTFSQELYTDLVENFLEEVKTVLEETLQSVETSELANLNTVGEAFLTKLGE